jgi:beta-1,4-mannosyl-glycoprotein beta-1,4-N-acetylglucosaminyltransferase
MITEVIYFLNELDILEAHLEQHRPWGMRTVIVESEVTISGVPKPLFFHENRSRFEKFDVETVVIPSDLYPVIEGPLDTQYRQFRDNDWRKRKWMQANFDAKNPWIFHSDVDEILAAKPEGFEEYRYVCFKLKQFTPQVNRRVAKTDACWRMVPSDMTVDMIAQPKRHKSLKIAGGWHFTNCSSSPEEIRLKAQCRPWYSGSLHPDDVPGVEFYADMWGKAMNPIAADNLGENFIVPLSRLPVWMAEHADQFPIAVE